MTPTAPNRSTRGREVSISAKRRHSTKSKVESYADWCTRVDASVDAAVREVTKNPPSSYAYLHPAQQRIVQMLIEHLRGLPELQKGECPLRKYGTINSLLTKLYVAKFPQWAEAERAPDGTGYIENLPNNEGETFRWLMQNCAGRAPVERVERLMEDDD